MGALSADQQSKAIVGAQYVGFALASGKDGMTLASEGIAASALSSALQAELVDRHANTHVRFSLARTIGGLKA